MPKILQLSPHIANLIAAGEVVERPASVVKELLENAVDAGASKVTIEIKNGGMTYLRVTDNGCGMSAEDARTAFLRHATSKLRTAEDLAAIGTMGFRGEALAAIASVSRIDLMTKTPGAISGTSLLLEAGKITEEDEVGCPDGTTIIVRDLFYNTPARMKFMKSDSVEGGKVAAAVQMQALAHPEVSFTFIRDGKQTLQTPGNGDLGAAVYCVYGRESAKFVEVSSRWEGYSLRGFVSKPTDARPSRSLQTFFVNDRPVKSRLLIQALEEAYRNQIMVGKFPACVLHLTIPPANVDVNVHPAKTEVKFLSEKAVFDCVHYGVLGALNKTPDRPQVQLKTPPATEKPVGNAVPGVPPAAQRQEPAKKQDFFRAMTAEEYKNFSTAVSNTPKVAPAVARPVIQAMNAERPAAPAVKQTVLPPVQTYMPPPPPPVPAPVGNAVPGVPPAAVQQVSMPEMETIQEELPMPKEIPWRMVGELYRSYILVEQGDEAFLIDKHAAHERILFEKLRANPQDITSQSLLSPIPVRLRADAAAQLLAKTALLEELGFEIEEFGENTVLVRRVPMDLGEGQVADTLMQMADDLLSGRNADTDTVRDELLHTMACKAAIKAGWKTDDKEHLALVKEVMSRDELKYCPHGRPICITLSKKMLEKQFKRT
ncbi:MAG: DNA mismatch repair endonuclease MutL [Oscillospiraceae bacterium]|nr:DNA mismatch repair endonuclease MutL [Oscillospiraceae bacterium]